MLSRAIYRKLVIERCQVAKLVSFLCDPEFQNLLDQKSGASRPRSDFAQTKDDNELPQQIELLNRIRLII